ncbi:hypothetical protein [Plantactinospora sp. GCM10030261]|uniref:hypothetical protein n=1 Tax=Plantactinospora sp. GCM10030261 TaxID=3273420 RepID=UPI003621519D
MQPDVPTTAHPIAQVNTGMMVIDATGAEVGRVIEVRTGDPNAVTVQEPPTGDGVLGDAVPHTGTGNGDEPDVPADLAARLLREGYVKVDAPELLADDVYVAAGQIERVAEDVVVLGVSGDQLARES